jgi:DNA-binding Lrp family transcriptional regulator
MPVHQAHSGSSPTNLSLGSVRQLSLDHRIAVALQLSGRASWRDIATMIGASESTVARHAKALLASGVMRTTLLADPVRCGFGYPVLVQLSCLPDQASEVARTLAARPDVRFVALVTGHFDVIAELIVASRQHLASVLVDDVLRTPGVLRTTTESVIRNFKLAYDWSRESLGTDADVGDGHHEVKGAPRPFALDHIDLALLGELREDGRRSYPQLAAACRISESAARRRVEALTAAGCLRPVTLVDPGFLGYDVEVFVWLELELGRMEQVAAALVERPEVRYVSATSGYSDMVAEVILRSQDDLYRFRAHVLGSLAGIRSADMAVELRTLKRAYLRLDEINPDGREAALSGAMEGP